MSCGTVQRGVSLPRVGRSSSPPKRRVVRGRLRSTRSRPGTGSSADGLEGVDLALAVPGVVADATGAGLRRAVVEGREERIGGDVGRAGQRVRRLLQGG